MSQDSAAQQRWNWHSEGLITALAVGGLLVVLGLVISLTPDIVNKTSFFFNNIQLTTYPQGNGITVNLPAPADPAAHNGFYSAVMDFALGTGILQILILALRVSVHSPIKRIAETVGNLIFYFGAALIINIFLMAGTLKGWFEFWPIMLIIIGVSLIVRFIILFVKR